MLRIEYIRRLCKMVILFIDFQGYLIEPKKFIAKELSVCASNELDPVHYLFKPPADISTLPRNYQK